MPTALVQDASLRLAHLLYWWFIPAAQFLLAMYVKIAPRPSRSSRVFFTRLY
jgi:hypothetical protein